MKRIAAALAAAVLLGASAPAAWRRTLPAGVAPPAIPADDPMSAAKVALGRRLFYDADLSIDGTMACSTCHEQHRGFADATRTHPGVHGDPGRRNVPGLANVAWLAPLTWGDPRVTSLESQALIPQTGSTPVEMGMAGQEAELARRLGRDPCYRRMFRAAFPATRGRIDGTAVAMALASFQRTLVSFDAPVDHGAAPAAGARLFAEACAGCHAGPLFTDGRFHRILPERAEDRGLAEISGRPEDAGRFRTPSLRNVAVTGPWLHDGSADTLAAAIRAHPDAPQDESVVTALTGYLEALTDRAFLTDPRVAYPDDVCRR